MRSLTRLCADCLCSCRCGETHTAWAVEIFVVLNVLTYGLVAVLDGVLDGRDVWGHEGDVADSLHWCEKADYTRLVRAPFTAYTCLVFLTYAYGVLVLAFVHTPAPTRNHLRSARVINLLQALVWIAGGVGSFLCHASVRGDWDVVDRLTIWPLIIMPISLTALRLVPVPASTCAYWVWFVATALVATAASIVVVAEDDAASTFLYVGVPTSVSLILVFILIKIGIECYHRRRFSQAPLYPLVLAVVFATLAFVFQRPEFVDPGDGRDECDGDSPWWRKTHGWWHIGQATALFLLWYWLFYEDETERPYYVGMLPDRNGDWRSVRSHQGWKVDLRDCRYPAVLPVPLLPLPIPVVSGPE
tara:strand:+ start:1297 stop:2373 length:1077 start_codon:yes stop_codon:yes gene_type:complete